MIAAIARLARRARSTALPQAARMIELAARVQGSGRTHGGIGGDTPPGEEPLRFVASDRMAMPIGDLAAVEMPADGDGQVRVTANVLGLVGTTPALPAYYSEVQLRRRRLRDLSMASFYNLFDHRALSFFYRITAKYRWVLGYEREGAGGTDPVSAMLLSYAGFPSPATRDRLGFADGMLAPLAGRLGDTRRSALSLAATLRHVTGLPLAIVEAEPTWMAVPAGEQTRIGGRAVARFARLGGLARDGEDEPDGAMLGQAVLDAQHHYTVDVGPLDHATLVAFVAGGARLAQVREVCRLAAGLEQRPTLRLRIAAADVPPLRLGDPAAPAVLARTTWLGDAGGRGGILGDCTIPLAAAA
ncbi:MAG: type VI secretion system baseplate subunit TssG [Sphingomonas fennica]